MTERIVQIPSKRSTRMNQSIEDLLIWSEDCGAQLRDTDIYCTRNEHDKDSPHQNMDITWWN